MGLEVVIFASNTGPDKILLKEAWKKRRGRRSAPVICVVVRKERADICLPAGEDPVVKLDLDTSQAERICEKALDCPDRHTALRFLTSVIDSLETDLPGIVNKGLFSLHELTKGVPAREDWQDACKCAGGVIGRKKKELLDALGYKVELSNEQMISLLKAGEEKVALAVLLNANEVHDVGSRRFNNMSPVSYALTKADNEKLPWVLMIQNDDVRLYATDNIGVGRRGRTETYLECNTTLLPAKQAGLLWLLFSHNALRKGGTAEDILKESRRFSEDIAIKLRERIYDTVVTELTMGIAKAREIANPDKKDLACTYEMALTVLFRLLFMAYAEDCDLLPYRSNESYRNRSLKQKAVELAKNTDAGRTDSQGNSYWSEVSELWNAVSEGHKTWGIPVYNGTMFSSDPDVSQIGAELAEIKVENEYMEKTLSALLLTEEQEILVPVDFRAISAREFGTIYEGLLESELSLAEQDLVTDKKGSYMPAKSGRDVSIKRGEFYLHNRSGARKSSGSYYTPAFIVEPLLDEALEKGLDEHLKKLEALDSEVDKAEQFFNFRVADISMGSGHFLVAAVDRMEKRLGKWLTENPLPNVQRELDRLRDVAKDALGKAEGLIQIEDGQLLRRMIAKRCIYGADVNPLAVQLARLAIWVHTFVPGLPLSLLDHNLVRGNSVVGVASLEEINNFGNSSSQQKSQNSGQTDLFAGGIVKVLEQAKEPLTQFAKIADSTLQEVAKSRELMQDAQTKVKKIRELCDVITAHPMADEKSAITNFSPEMWLQYFESDAIRPQDRQSQQMIEEAENLLRPLDSLHFPVVFPEVFLGPARGFHVIVGNPPWEEPIVNEDKFWGRYNPGLSGLTPRKQKIKMEELKDERSDLVKVFEQEKKDTGLLRNFLKGGNFPGMGTGDPDLYKAFAWRFWNLASPVCGKISVVLPRQIMASKGSEIFRKKMLVSAREIRLATLQNTGGWIFDIHHDYAIVLLSIAKGKAKEPSVFIEPVFKSEESFGKKETAPVPKVLAREILNWTSDASFPAIPRHDSIEVFAALRKSPRLDLNDGKNWRARPDRELDATNQKHLMDLDSEQCPEGFWKVYKGESFLRWNPDTGRYNAWADPEPVLDWLYNKRLRSNRLRKSVHAEFSREHIADRNTLAPLHPRIAFRDICSKATPRSVIAALIPPETFITNTAPYLLFPRGDNKDEAFLLAVLCSLSLDWYARRFVELHLSFYILDSLPVPRPDRSNKLWQRVVSLSGRLACPDERFAEWAKQVGVDYGPLAQDEKQDHIHEIDALVTHLYGLSKSQLRHIFETFHENWDYESDYNEVLRHYKAWANKA